MKLGWVIFVVPDVAATVAFYEAAFGLARRFVAEDGTYGEMETGASTLAFVAETLAADSIPTPLRPNRPSDLPAAAQITLVTDDVAAGYERAIAAGAAPLAGPTATSWGQTVAYLRDTNGVLVELGTPVSS